MNSMHLVADPDIIRNGALFARAVCAHPAVKGDLVDDFRRVTCPSCLIVIDQMLRERGVVEGQQPEVVEPDEEEAPDIGMMLGLLVDEDYVIDEEASLWLTGETPQVISDLVPEEDRDFLSTLMGAVAMAGGDAGVALAGRVLAIVYQLALKTSVFSYNEAPEETPEAPEASEETPEAPEDAPVEISDSTPDESEDQEEEE